MGLSKTVWQKCPDAWMRYHRMLRFLSDVRQARKRLLVVALQEAWERLCKHSNLFFAWGMFDRNCKINHFEMSRRCQVKQVLFVTTVVVMEVSMG